MILGIGIDTVEIERFALWHSYDRKKLLRIFSESEIEYCLSNPILAPQRFAVRFAAREALFKAMSAHWAEHTIPFLTLCRATTIIKKRAPHIILDWNMLQCFNISDHSAQLHLSMSHTAHVATAIVILESL